MRLEPGTPFKVDMDARKRAILDRYGNSHSLRSIVDGEHSLIRHFVSAARADQDFGFVRRGTCKPGLWIPTTTFGYAFAKPYRVDRLGSGCCLAELSDDPERLGWYVDGGYFADEGLGAQELARTCVANALRKLRALTRHFQVASGPWSTMQMKQATPPLFRDTVKATEVDMITTIWGDFPYEGGVAVVVGPWLLLGALSGFTGPQDHVQITKALVRFGEWLLGHVDDEIYDEPAAAA